MSLKQRKKVSALHSPAKVHRMVVARKKASSQIMSESEFYLQCPKEVRVPASRGQLKSMSS